jgi:hypothetical protein
MWLIYRIACMFGWHSWWDTGDGELVCVHCRLVVHHHPMPS